MAVACSSDLQRRYGTYGVLGSATWRKCLMTGYKMSAEGSKRRTEGAELLEEKDRELETEELVEVGIGEELLDVDREEDVDVALLCVDCEVH